MAEIVSAKLIENAVHLCVGYEANFRQRRHLGDALDEACSSHRHRHDGALSQRAIFTRYDAKLGREASVQW